MTRINLIPPEDLCDQHLLAEWRELTRIPNSIISGKLKVSLDRIPNTYKLRTNDNPNGGKGHVLFFTNKLKFLYDRYHKILRELEIRDIECGDNWPDHQFDRSLWNDFNPLESDIKLNLKRISERFPKSPRYCGEKL